LAPVSRGRAGVARARRRVPAGPSMKRALKKILIVEDDDLDMKLFHDLLEGKGYAILQTRDGRHAMTLAREHRPDLILMDIQLPEVSGLEVTDLMKKDPDLKSIPIIAVTAFVTDGDTEAMRMAGYSACIAKPISIAEFLGTIEQVLI
jgi:two-component system cell cycle response regulator DivK